MYNTFVEHLVYKSLYLHLKPLYPNGTRADYNHFVNYLQQKWEGYTALNNKDEIVVEDQHSVLDLAYSVDPAFSLPIPANNWDELAENIKIAALISHVPRKKYFIPSPDEYTCEVTALQQQDTQAKNPEVGITHEAWPPHHSEEDALTPLQTDSGAAEEVGC